MAVVVGLAAFAVTLVVCRCGTLELRQMESSLRQEKVPEDCLEKGNSAGEQEETASKRQAPLVPVAPEALEECCHC